MLLFFKNPKNTIYVIATEAALAEGGLNKLWEDYYGYY